MALVPAEDSPQGRNPQTELAQPPSSQALFPCSRLKPKNDGRRDRRQRLPSVPAPLATSAVEGAAVMGRCESQPPLLALSRQSHRASASLSSPTWSALPLMTPNRHDG